MLEEVIAGGEERTGLTQHLGYSCSLCEHLSPFNLHFGQLFFANSGFNNLLWIFAQVYWNQKESMNSGFTSIPQLFYASTVLKYPKVTVQNLTTEFVYLYNRSVQ